MLLWKPTSAILTNVSSVMRQNRNGAPVLSKAINEGKCLKHVNNQDWHRWVCRSVRINLRNVFMTQASIPTQESFGNFITNRKKPFLKNLFIVNFETLDVRDGVWVLDECALNHNLDTHIVLTPHSSSIINLHWGLNPTYFWLNIIIMFVWTNICYLPWSAYIRVFFLLLQRFLENHRTRSTNTEQKCI